MLWGPCGGLYSVLWCSVVVVVVRTSRDAQHDVIMLQSLHRCIGDVMVWCRVGTLLEPPRWYQGMEAMGTLLGGIMVHIPYTGYYGA